MPARQSLGQKIRALRKELKMTQQELAGEEFTKSFISQIEKDIAKPSLKSLQIIASRLGKPVSYFLDEEPDNRPSSIPDRVFHLITLGQRLEENNLPRDAAEYYQQALDEISPDPSTLRAKLHSHLARAMAAAQDCSQAVSLYQQAADQFLSCGEPHQAAKAHVRAAQILFSLSQWEEAQSGFSEAGDLLDPLELDFGFYKAVIQYYQGLIHRRLNENRRALDCLTEALQTCMCYQTFVYYGPACLEAGLIHLEQGSLDDADQLLTRAMHFFLSVNNEQDAARSRIHLGEVKLRTNDNSAAADLLSTGLSVLQFWVYPAETFKGHILLAQIAEGAGDFERAMEYVKTANEFAPTRRDNAKSQIQMARLLRLQGQAEESIKRLTGLSSVVESLNEPEILAEFYSDLADSYSAVGQQEKAQEYLRKSLSIYRRLT